MSTDWPDAGTVQVVDRLRTRVLSTPAGAKGLTVDAPGGLHAYVDPESAFEMYEREAQVDRRVLRVRRDTDGTTRILGATPGTLGLGDVTMSRIGAAPGELKTRLTTTRPDGFEFVDRVAFSGGMDVGDARTTADGNTFVSALQIWKRIPGPETGEHLHGATNLIAYRYVINDYGELQLIKYTAFNGPTPDSENTHVSKVVAVHGPRMLLPSDTSTAPNDVMASFVGSLPTRVPSTAAGSGYWFRSADVVDALFTLDRIGIGTNAPMHTLHVVGDPDADSVFSNIPIHTSSNLVCHTMMTESDARVKTAVRAIDARAAARAVADLRPCSYLRLDGPSAGEPIQGFIAQEVRAAVPAAVTVRPSPVHGIEDFHYVDPMPLIANLVAAVQNLTRRVDALAAARPAAARYRHRAMLYSRRGRVRK